MCEFVSFVVTKDGRLLAGHLTSHAGIEAGWGLKPGEYREAEWTHDDDGDSLTVRVEDGEDPNWYKAIVLAQCPTRRDLLARLTVGKTDEATYHYRDGKLHRDGDKPACIWADGTKEWYRDGERQR